MQKKPKVVLKISSTSKAAAAAAARAKKGQAAAASSASSITLAALGREALARTTKSIKMASASAQGPVAPRWGRCLSAR